MTLKSKLYALASVVILLSLLGVAQMGTISDTATSVPKKNHTVTAPMARTVPARRNRIGGEFVSRF